MNDSSGKYFVKNTASGSFSDITTLFDGVAILKLSGMDSKGKAINIYQAQWINSQTEDFLITTVDNNDNPVVIRENVDIEITFIVRRKYATNKTNFDVLAKHDAFVDYMTNHDVWVKSSYLGNKYVHAICIKEYRPTTIRLDRGDDSYMMGTITLHTLEAPHQ